MPESQILFLPGPTPVPSRVLRAMAAPAINHRGPEFRELLYEVTEGVKEIFQTKNDLFILTTSGTGAMEAAVVNFLAPGDKAVVVSIGAFGERFKDICRNYGVEVIPLDFPWGEAADARAVEEILAGDQNKEIKAILVQHNETSTGVLNDIEAISRARGDHPALIIVDAISGLAAADLKTDAWNLDVVLGGSQKAFMMPPGLAMISVSARAWEAYERCNNHRYYFDLGEAKKFLANGQTPFTPAVSLFYALKEALLMMREEGLPAIIARHAVYRDMVRAACRALGLELLASDRTASPAVTAVKVPAGLRPADITGPSREKFGVVFAGGQGKLKNDIFRIGHLGWVEFRDLFAGIGVLELVLREKRNNVVLGAGVAAAQKVYEERKAK